MVELYKALVEPNLIFAAESSWDCNGYWKNQMLALQTQFCRFILGLHKKAMKHLTLADMGVLPLKLRRTQLAARYYWQTRTFPSHLAFDAMEDSRSLARETTSCRTAVKFRGWYFKFCQAVQGYGLNIDCRKLAFDLYANMIEAEELRINLTTSRLGVFKGTALSYVQQPCLRMPRSLVLHEASLRSSTHF